MAFITSTTPDPQNINNPTKEILASSGIYDEKVLSNKLYADDSSNSIIANTGINSTTTSTTTTPAFNPSGILNHLSNPGYFIDDMLVFNNYIHYDSDMFGTIRTFNPRSFLEQANVAFNIYSMEYRQ